MQGKEFLKINEALKAKEERGALAAAANEARAARTAARWAMRASALIAVAAVAIIIYDARRPLARGSTPKQPLATVVLAVAPLVERPADVDRTPVVPPGGNRTDVPEPTFTGPRQRKQNNVPCKDDDALFRLNHGKPTDADLSKCARQLEGTAGDCVKGCLHNLKESSHEAVGEGRSCVNACEKAQKHQ
jgi:hypothetical protein